VLDHIIQTNVQANYQLNAVHAQRKGTPRGHLNFQKANKTNRRYTQQPYQVDQQEI
jgi:hypothetical protein